MSLLSRSQIGPDPRGIDLAILPIYKTKGDKMTLFHKVILSIGILFAASGNATTQNVEINDTLKAQLVAEFIQATVRAGRCTGSWDCSWPTTQCVGNRCVKPNGDGGQCSGSWDCSWPTPTCSHGNCVNSSGGGGECTGSWDCSWPYSSCKNGFCERP